MMEREGNSEVTAKIMTDGAKAKFSCVPTLKRVEAGMPIVERAVQDVYGGKQC